MASAKTPKVEQDEAIRKLANRIACALERIALYYKATLTPEQLEAVKVRENPANPQDEALEEAQPVIAAAREAAEVAKAVAVGEAPVAKTESPIPAPVAVLPTAGADFLSDAPTAVKAPAAPAAPEVTIEDVRATLTALAKKDGKRDRGLEILARLGEGAAALPGSAPAAQGGVKVLDKAHFAEVVKAAKALLT